jgi:hypothetical protein
VPGYTFQSQRIRAALVVAKRPEPAAPPAETPEPEPPADPQLELGDAVQ